MVLINRDLLVPQPVLGDRVAVAWFHCIFMLRLVELLFLVEDFAQHLSLILVGWFGLAELWFAFHSNLVSLLSQLSLSF